MHGVKMNIFGVNECLGKGRESGRRRALSYGLAPGV